MKTYKLENLDCAHCASVIEGTLQRLEGVRAVRVQFATLDLHIDADDMEKVRQTIAGIEPGVTVTDLEKAPVEPVKKALPEWLFLALGTLALGTFLVLESLAGMTGWLAFSGFAVVYLGAGWPVLRKAGGNLVRGKVFDENFLMAVATLAAWVVGAGAEAASVMVFYQWGEYFQGRAVARSRRSLGALLSSRPRTVRVLSGGTVAEVRPEEVSPGTHFEVRAGEHVPLDGVVISGAGSVDTSALTGESLPRSVVCGEEVAAGAVNLEGVLQFRAVRFFRDSAWAGIVASVDHALGGKTPLERFITRFARAYTPAVLTLALMLFLVLTFLGTPWHDSLYRSLVLLVISCPCALVVSIPLTYLGAIGSASRKGVLIRDPGALDRLSRLSVAAFDKTGTLTEGLPAVKAIIPAGDEPTLRSALDSGFAASTHPLGRIWGASGPSPENTVEVRGQGVTFQLAGVRTGIGRRSFLVDQGFIGVPEGDDLATTVHAADASGYLGRVDFEDPPKAGVPETVQGLRNHGLRHVALLSGDSSAVVDRWGREWNLDEAWGGLLPGEKLDKVDRWENSGDRVLFVGDGLNDAPVLARASVGVSLGAGASAAAVETADVAILDGAPGRVVTLLRLGKRTKTILYQNIGFALGLKVLFMILGGLGLAGLWEAVFADAGVALLAVLNSLRAGRSLD